MLSIVLFVIITSLLFLGNYKPVPQPVPQPVVAPFAHHDVVLRGYRELLAYADFILDGGEVIEL